MSDFFYRQAGQAMDLWPDMDGGPGTRTIALTWRIMGWCAAILLGAFATSQLWVAAGGTVWLGYREMAVRVAPAWMRTPVSDNVINDGGAIGLPVYAHAGQEVIIHYTLETDVEGDGHFAPASVHISCAYRPRDGMFHRIERQGSGIIVHPALAPCLYQIEVRQRPRSDGRTSLGVFTWGVRKTSNARQP